MELIVQYKSNYFLAAFHLTQTMDLEAGNGARLVLLDHALAVTQTNQPLTYKDTNLFPPCKTSSTFLSMTCI